MATLDPTKPGELADLKRLGLAWLEQGGLPGRDVRRLLDAVPALVDLVASHPDVAPLAQDPAREDARLAPVAVALMTGPMPTDVGTVPLVPPHRRPLEEIGRIVENAREAARGAVEKDTVGAPGASPTPEQLAHWEALANEGIRPPAWATRLVFAALAAARNEAQAAITREETMARAFEDASQGRRRARDEANDARVEGARTVALVRSLERMLEEARGALATAEAQVRTERECRLANEAELSRVDAEVGALRAKLASSEARVCGVVRVLEDERAARKAAEADLRRAGPGRRAP
jgi:hypothetical protein